MNSQMTIGKKITLLAASLVVLAVVQGLVALNGVSSVREGVARLSSDAIPGLRYSQDIAVGMYRFRGDAWKHISSSDGTTMAAVEQEMSAVKDDLATAMKGYEKSITQDEDRANFNQIKPLLDRYYQAWEGVLPLSRASRNEEAYRKYMSDVDPAYQALRKHIDVVQAWNVAYGEKASSAAESSASSARWWTIALLLLVIGVGVAASAVVVRGVASALGRIISDLAQGARQVGQAANQVSSSAQSLAQGSSEQAASLEETSASVQEINSMAARNGENSRSAAELVTQSALKFVDANKSLDEMVVAMDGIHAQSGKISRIIKVIDEIAFQTNILALNAAVEAARAGQAGLGFAVVAEEVRNLAQRSAQAAQETSALIEESIVKSNEGKAKVDAVTSAIHEITGHASQVKILVDEVMQSSDEQARGINQIGTAVGQMERVTQSSAASAEESAAAAQELSSQSETLNHVVGELVQLVGSAQ